MSDIFISYAGEDRDRAGRLAEALRSEGWSVFWDRSVPPGQTWRGFIGAELAQAHCVLVAWSKSSVESHWVMEEADDGRAREILVPVFFDDVKPPLGFRHIQAANLINWTGSRGAPEYQQLLGAVRPLTDKSSSDRKADTSIPGALTPEPATIAGEDERKPAQEPGMGKAARLPPRPRAKLAIAGGLFTVLVVVAIAMIWKDPFEKEPVAPPSDLIAAHPDSPRDPLQDGSLVPEMVTVPKGTFKMGDLQGDGGPDERPVRTLSIRSFGIGRHEVTFDEYDRFAAATGREKPDDQGWGRGRRPVINVSWEDVAAYAEWLSKQTGKRYRLPSEAEWEYAARARTTTRYWWGEDINQDGRVWANCDGCGSQWDNEQTAPVGSFPANEIGLHDTVGNVWEWVQDCWHDSYEAAPTDGSARKGESCGQRVVRGGSWDGHPGYVRSANRFRHYPDTWFNFVGFRLAQDIE